MTLTTINSVYLDPMWWTTALASGILATYLVRYFDRGFSFFTNKYQERRYLTKQKNKETIALLINNEHEQLMHLQIINTAYFKTLFYFMLACALYGAAIIFMGVQSQILKEKLPMLSKILVLILLFGCFYFAISSLKQYYEATERAAILRYVRNKQKKPSPMSSDVL